MMLVPFLHSPGGAVLLNCFLAQELPLVLGQSPVLIDSLRRELILVVELDREAESGSKAALGDASADCSFAVEGGRVRRA